MAIVQNLADAKAPDVSYGGYGDDPITGVPGYTSITVGGIEGLRVYNGATYTQLMAQGTSPNQALVLSPKGTSGVQAQLPDGSVTNGNARGAYAVDWQTQRTTAAKVASGTNATIAGGNDGLASGSYSSLGGGTSNTVTGFAATVAGGQGNTNGGTQAWVPGGSNANTRSTQGRGAWGSGQFAATGDAQSGEFCLRRQSTDGTGVVLSADALAPTSANIANLANNSTYLVTMLVVARQTGGAAGSAGDSAGWIINALCKRDGTGTVTLVGGGGALIAPTYFDAAATAWRVSVAGAGTSGGIVVTGQGEANKNINWYGRIMSAESAG